MLPLRLRLWLANRVWHLRLAAARRLLAPGPRTWEALDRLGVPGHGISLLRVDFPPDLALKLDWGAVRAGLTPLLDANANAQDALLAACLATAGELRAWPEQPDPARPDLPWRRNEFLPPVDMAVLHGLLRHTRPERYVEIGSGISTRVAAAARRAGGFAMPILSVDPEPRVEVAALCDEVRRRRLEECVSDVLAAVTPRSVLFFDGSHRCLPKSDVTVFFLDLLPRLPAGCLVHIHDIVLPEDYPPAFTDRLWSEQYLLAAWLLGGGHGLEILLPCARLAAREPARAALAAVLGSDAVTAGGSSFWFRKT